MAEALSPNAKLRAAFSPIKSPFFIGSNDDKLERAQSRAARAAAIRRKAAVPTSADANAADPCLGKEQILELFQNCIKLASENKINQKNTWELKLIDHLYQIIKVEEENDSETNFQKASCTLEAGVKIYSLRVDSVHSEAYKVLGGINRVGQEDEQDHAYEDSSISNGQVEGNAQKEQHRKLSPLATLESSFAAINVKKFDVAFVVDPLYHQTSAQFDEGGAKGLLLNNLGVYGNCRVLFDSLEVPGKCSSSIDQHDGGATIDLSFALDCIELMVTEMIHQTEITPSLRSIVNQFDIDNQRPSELYSSSQKTSQQVNNESSNYNPELEVVSYGETGTWDFDHDDLENAADVGTYEQYQNVDTQHNVSDMVDEQLNFDAVEDDRCEAVDDYLLLSLGFSKKQNAWAGPDHWKYRKIKDPENPTEETGSPKVKKTKNKRENSDIGFSSAVNADLSHIFAPPKNPKSLLLPANRPLCRTKLPEDCHYQPEDLVKFFLLPNVLCLQRNARKRTGEESLQRDGDGATVSWDDEDGSGGVFDDWHAYSDTEESSTLVSQPRQVNKIEVQYDKTSKQVDVQALKETLWDHILELNQSSVPEKEAEKTISFKQVLTGFPEGCRAAASINDISPHLCFICLLHLANEHGLRILGCPSLDDLCIHVKPQRHP